MYDGDGNRISQTAGGVTTKYLVDTLNPTGYSQVMDETVSGAVTRTYSYGLQRISENQLIGGTWKPSFYGYDGHGNIRFLANSAGVVTDTYQFDAFGAPIASTGTTSNPYLFSGERFDSSLNLYHLRARYYNLLTGRFITMEPWQQKSCCSARSCPPQSSNSFTYGDDNPVNRIDPTGHAAVEYAIDLRPAIIASAGLILFSQNARCAAQLTICIADCVDAVGTDEWPFRRCVKDCMAAAGCDYTIPRPFPQ